MPNISQNQIRGKEKICGNICPTTRQKTRKDIFDDIFIPLNTTTTTNTTTTNNNNNDNDNNDNNK